MCNTMEYKEAGMIISLRLSEDDAVLFRKYAELNSMNLSEMIRQTVLSRIEAEYDAEIYRAALAEYKENPATVPLEEVHDGKD